MPYPSTTTIWPSLGLYPEEDLFAALAEQVTLDPVEVAEGSVFPASVRAVGTAAAGTGNIVPALPAGTAEGDILNLFIETAAEAVTVPTGWAHVTGSPVTQSTNTRLTWLWKRATASEVAPTITDPGDHAIARIVGVKDAAAAGYPFETSDTATEATSDTSVSIPGNATPLRGPNRLILAAVSTGADILSTAQATSWANIYTTTITERVDDWTDAGNGGGIGVASFVVEYGMRTYAATTATLSTAAPKALMSAAILPAIRKQLELNTAPLRVLAEGIDWGDGAIQAYLAEGQIGSTQVDYRVPNREVSIPLAVRDTSQAAVQNALQSVAAKVATIQREGGGWLKRQWGSGRKVYLDVLNAAVHIPDKYSHLGFEPDLVLKLEAVPEFYGDEIALSDHVETSLPELIFTETITGDWPARARIVVDNDSTSDQRGLIVANRYYQSAGALAIPQSTMLLADGVTRTAGTGSTEAQVIQCNTLDETWTSVSIFNGSHHGTYRVYARVRSSTAGPWNEIAVRLVWRVGGVFGSFRPNPITTIPRPSAAGDWYTIDLGEVILGAPIMGAPRWRGAIQAAYRQLSDAPQANPDIQLDRVWLVPTEQVKCVVDSVDLSVGTLQLQRSDFDQATAGAITGQSLEMGGTWAGSGDPDDFVANTYPQYGIQRTAVNDAAYPGGRLIFATTTAYTSVGIAATIRAETLPTAATIGGPEWGVVARWVDANNFWMFVVDVSSPTFYQFKAVKVAAGVATRQQYVQYSLAAQTWYSLQVVVDSNGTYTAGLAPTSESNRWEGALPLIRGSDSTLVGGGSHQSGRVGLFDWYVSGVAGPDRRFGSFVAWTYERNAVAYNGHSVELSPDGVWQQDSVASYNNKLPTPGVLRPLPSGPEDRPVEFFVKQSRGRFDNQDLDNGIDDVSARVFYRPCWLQIPSS